LQQHDKTRTYKRLRQVVGDPRRNSIVFYNEICSDTHVSRLPGESSLHREERALRKLAEWYRQHTGKRIVILSELFTSSSSQGVDVYSVEQYLKEMWPEHTTLQNLREVLKEAEIEEDLDTIRLFSSADSKKGRPVAGYTEVCKTGAQNDQLSIMLC
jgi:DIS3-like exonuclease 1